jgi:WXXGXW repeat (2 copies)
MGTAIAVGLMFLLSAGGCKKTPVAAPMAADDPANVNMAPATGTAAVLADRETASQNQQGEDYPDSNQQGQPGNYEADQPPPPLPDYAQPVATRPNTIWTPGYWQHSPSGYYWVPGAWVAPPYIGALWTPGYWGADGERYRFHPGYWGRHVGFYGGVPYGGGYLGTGYRGGYWRGDQFYYNQAVNRVDPSISFVYNQPEPAYGGVRVSYNGGRGGISIGPIAAEIFALHERHERPLRYQDDMEREYAGRRGQFYDTNRGRPEVYIAGDGFQVGVGRPVIVDQRPVVIEQREGPPGHAYGLYKDHGDHGNGHGKEDHGDHGNGHGNDGHGNDGHGDNGNGKGHGHDK